MALDGVAKIECQLLAVDGRQNGASPYSLPVAPRAAQDPGPASPACPSPVDPGGSRGGRGKSAAHTEVGQRRGKDGNGSA